MADGEAEVPNGLHVKAGNTDLSASDQSVRTLSEAFNHWWFGTLDWLGTHPIYGGLVFVLALAALSMWFRLRVQKQNQRHEYDMFRASVQTQIPLPLPTAKNPQIGHVKEGTGDGDA